MADELLLLSSSEDKQNYPELSYLEQALVCIYLWLYNKTKQTILKNFELSEEDIYFLLRNGSDKDLLYLNPLSVMTCGLLSERIIEYINDQFPGMFSCILLSSNTNLKHFEDDKGHSIAIFHSYSSGEWFAFSPANIFNLDLSTPTFRDQSFTRIRGVIHAAKFEDLVLLIQEIEGGEWSIEKIY